MMYRMGYGMRTSHTICYSDSPSDMLGTSSRYCLADLYNTDTMYHPPDIHWHVLNDTMSQYYLHYYRILGLNGVVKHHQNSMPRHSVALNSLDTLYLEAVN